MSDRSTTAAALVLTLGLAACEDRGPQGPGPGEPPVELAFETVVTGLNNPIYLTAPPNDDRLFIVEQPGRILIVEDGALRTEPFLDIRSDVSFGGERGLFSVAFHPGYATNRTFFVHYTNTGGDTRVVRYETSANPYVADPASASVVLALDQPFGNHNGGHVLFGPDGMLYVALGDGGSAGDPQDHGQNRGTLLGALLRIDVDGATPYAIPPDNPFVGTPGARGEIWLYGVRNPWRVAFDAAADLFYVADVGENVWEEVTVVPAGQGGLNLGWNIMEGLHCFNAANCNTTGLILPAIEYDHGDGCSVTGGFVYRGVAMPGLAGHYFYSDYCSGFLRSFRYADGAATDARDWDVPNLGAVLSFGADAMGELYVLTADGTVRRMVPADVP